MIPRCSIAAPAHMDRPTRPVRLSRLAALALLTLPLACSSEAPSDHAGHGIAVDVDPAARTVTLDHDEIPGLMMAMTMTFPVAPDVDLASVEKGSSVDFEVRSEGSTVTVTAIEKAATAEPAAP